MVIQTKSTIPFKKFNFLISLKILSSRQKYKKLLFYNNKILNFDNFLILSYNFNYCDKIEKIFICFIFSGAIGNWIDRFLHGFVIDFIHLHYGDLHWYVFNIADIFVSMGIFLTFIFQMFTMTMLLMWKKKIN